MPDALTLWSLAGKSHLTETTNPHALRFALRLGLADQLPNVRDDSSGQRVAD